MGWAFKHSNSFVVLFISGGREEREVDRWISTDAINHWSSLVVKSMKAKLSIYWSAPILMFDHKLWVMTD